MTQSPDNLAAIQPLLAAADDLLAEFIAACERTKAATRSAIDACNNVSRVIGEIQAEREGK